MVNDGFVDAATGAVRANVADVAERLADAGAAVHEVRPPVELALVHDAHRVVTFAECASHHLPAIRHTGAGPVLAHASFSILG